jgi:SAM-dependent methyltransferase
VTGESIAFDRVATTYDDTRGGMERGRGIAALLDRRLPAGPLLEVGVGTGLVAAGLTELGRTPVGVDLSLPMLAVARDRLPGRVAAGDAQRLPVRSGAVAGAYLVHVLHLVGSIPGTLAELARVLRPGGTLVVTAFPDVELPDDLHVAIRAFRGRLGGGARRDDAEDLVVRLAAEAGFTLVERLEEPARPVTPRLAAAALAARTMSWTWLVEDADWEREFPALLAELRALPGQDTPRPAPGLTILVLRR